MGLRAQSGLSPPTRGSHGGYRAGVFARGSIPAHAGEPIVVDEIRPLVRVYPRPRGGAPLQPASLATTIGLSPPTRGSHRSLAASVRSPGSIPAHAGEHILPPVANGRSRVYPRPRGGASSAWVSNWSITGLSPPRGGAQGPCPPHPGCQGLSPLPQHANMTYLLRHDPTDIIICQKTQVSASGGARRTRSTPSASQTSFGGSPKWRRASLPDSATSRWINYDPTVSERVEPSRYD